MDQPDVMEMYRPHAKAWIEREIGDCSDYIVESLAYLLAGCYADGEMSSDKYAKITKLEDTCNHK